MSQPSRLAAALGALVLFACDGPPMTPSDAGTDAGPDATAPSGSSALAVYSGSGFYDAPFPDERMRRPDGTISIASFPNPRGVSIVSQLVDVLEGSPGFGLTSTIYFPLSAPIDTSSLPESVHASLDAASSVFLIDVDPDSPSPGARQPVDVAFLENPRPFGPRNVLAVMPMQGRPLAPDRLYAAVVTTGVRAADGSPLGRAPQTAQLLAGEQPQGLSDAAFDAHTTAITAARAAGVSDDAVAVMAVFRTWDPTLALREAAAQVIEEEAAGLELEAAPTLLETHEDFCVFRTTVLMPDYQGGEAPYQTEGGAWVRDAEGRLVVQRRAQSSVFITVPRATMPDDGFPLVMFIRVGGGGDRPLVDRGVRVGGAESETGGGPARTYAQAGWAGIQVDGPLGGLRNTANWDEAFALFNINNPRGLRDNVRETALETILFAHVLDRIRFDASTCEGFASSDDDHASFDIDTLTLVGHSNGASVAPLVLATEPLFRATILSGAGSSWIMNVIHKESPISVRPAASSLLGYLDPIVPHDPVLALLQWAGESADSQVYAPYIVLAPRAGAPRHVLMFQGILDTYIPPPIANALTLSMGLDVIDPILDGTLEDRFVSLADVIDLSGRARLDAPASGNHGAGTVTAIVAQHPEDGVEEDGHEVMFQTPEPKLQYRCFLESLAQTGMPRVPRRDATSCD